jgi:hypothetical protein
MKRSLLLLGALIPVLVFGQPWTITGTFVDNDQPLANTWIQFINPAEPDVVIAETMTDENGLFLFETDEWPLDVDLTVQSSACEEIDASWEASNELALVDYFLICDPQFFEETLNVHAYPMTDDNLTWLLWTSGEGEPDGYLWTIPETSVYTTPEVIHTFEESGIFPVFVTTSYPSGNVINVGYDLVVGDLEEQNCEAFFFLAEEETDEGTTGDLFFYNASIGEDLEYLWDFGDGNTSTEAFPTNVFPDENLEYEVCLTITGAGGCFDQFCLAVSGSMMSGVIGNQDLDPHSTQAKDGGMTMTVLPMPTAPLVSSQTQQNLDFSLFPNPTKGNLTLIVSPGSPDYGMFRITDLQGRLLREWNAGLIDSENRLDLHLDLPQGLYTIEFLGEQYRGVSRFAITR